MHFNNPNILYALFALLIPILVHLFQLRKFQKTAFTNVKFLQELIVQTRKSSQIKKWLILITRLLLFSCIIFAFSEPSFNKNNSLKQEPENIFYIDNSFSTQEKGAKGELMRLSIQELLHSYPNNRKVSIITNTKVFKNKTLNSLKRELINLEYSPYQLDYKTINLKANQLFSNKVNTKKRIIYISDFQKRKAIDSSNFNTDYENIFIQTLPVSKSNISIDSAYFSNRNTTTSLLNVLVKKQHSDAKNVPIALYNNDSLISKTTVDLTNNSNIITFNVSSQNHLNLKIKLSDTKNIHDNTLYLSKPKPNKINILAIGNTVKNQYLSKIYTDEEFDFIQNEPNNINYSLLEQQHLIILNELETIPVTLIKNLIAFTKNGGTVLSIPSEKIDIKNYNSLVNVYGTEDKHETRLTKIHFSHPIFFNVFEKKIKNFQYPIFNNHYKLSKYQSTILSLENGNPLLVKSNNHYVFSAALNTKNSNFKQAPLIVPTLYNIAKSTLKFNTPYYIIGDDNTIDIPLKLTKDEVVSLQNNTTNFIPLQQIKTNKVSIQTSTEPNEAGFYSVISNQNTVPIQLAYNYNHSESIMTYHNLSTLKSAHIKIATSVTNTIDEINSASQIGTLWKWFIIFAIFFLIVELLILKYFK